MSGPEDSASKRLPGEGPALVQDVLGYISGHGSDFDALALRALQYQARHNLPYARFLKAMGCDPETFGHWTDVPPLPTSAFKDAVLSTGSGVHTFTTSGTTRGGERRGQHHLPTLDLYAASWPEPFRRALLPDTDRMLIVGLVPDWSEVPESSLAYMVRGVIRRFGKPGSRSYLSKEKLHVTQLANGLGDASENGEPVLILATALALDAFLDAVVAPIRLVAGSRIMDTGGFKGRKREVSRSEMLERYQDRLGIPPSHVVGEYGMTELSSQAYEGSLQDSQRTFANAVRRYQGPAWLPTRVLDPVTLQEVPPGETGLLAHCDLANACTVSSVVTEDLGRMHDDGFEVLGRAPGADLRGCSLLTEEITG